MIPLNDSERISLLIDTLEGGNAKKFSERTGIDNTVVSRIKTGEFKIGVRIEPILKAYPQVNREWLMTGNGYAGDLSIDIMRRHYLKVIADRDDTIRTLAKEIEILQRLIEEK